MEQGPVETARRVVLFDFDGVLIRGDTFAMFMRDRYARVRRRENGNASRNHGPSASTKPLRTSDCLD